MKVKQIYVTAPSSLCGGEWLGIFVEKLKMAFDRTTRQTFNWVVKSNENDDWSRNIAESDFFMVILDAHENHNDAYLNELYAISDNVQKKAAKELPAHFIFKICLTPSKDIRQPALFQPLCGYNFFEYTGRKDNLSVFSFDEQDQNVKAWKQLLDMAFDFKEIYSAPTTKEMGLEINKKNLYLSLCTSDLLAVRSEIKRELQHLGYNVLPKIDLMHNFSDFDDIVTENLQVCSYVLQLVGVKYGEIPADQKISVFERENNLFGNFLKSNNNLTRLIWIPDSVRNKEQKQELYINRLKQKEADQSTEIIESTVDEFKEILKLRLSVKPAESPLPSSKGEVYYITSNQKAVESFKQYILQHNLSLQTLDLNDKENLYQQHLELLKRTNHVIIDWVKKDRQWLNSKLSDLIKAPGMGKKQNFTSIGIITNGVQPDIQGYKSWLPDIQIMQQENHEEINKFLEKIHD